MTKAASAESPENEAWLASLVEKRPSSIEGPEDAPVWDAFPLKRMDSGPHGRYAKFPQLSAQHAWQLVSLHRLLAASSMPPAPAIDLLSGLGDDAPEEPHLLTFDADGRAHV